MARLALQLPVFISSPSDVQNERDEVEQVIVRIAGDAARHGLLLSVYKFEKDATPAFGRPLDQSNVDLRASELVIAIFGNGVGSPARVGETETGTLEEIRIAEVLLHNHLGRFFHFGTIGGVEEDPGGGFQGFGRGRIIFEQCHLIGQTGSG